MIIQSAWQLSFDFFGSKPVVVEPSAGQVSSDAGLLPFRQLDERLGLTRQFAEALTDRRARRLRRPYLPGDDPRTDLRHPGRLRRPERPRRVAERSDLQADLRPRRSSDDDLASQPTLSRFENAIDPKCFFRLQDVLLDQFIASFDKPPTHLTLDIDPFDDPTHGQQQLTFFHGYYEQYQYLPRVITCAENDLVLAVCLLHGTAHADAWEPQDDVAYVVRRLREAWPGVRIHLRGDSGFGTPTMYEACEQLGHRLHPRHRHERDAEKVQRCAAGRGGRRDGRPRGQPQRLFTAFWYRAESWPAQRWVVVKCEANAQGTNRRAVVTNRPGAFVLPGAAYDGYADRGESENRNKELKDGLQADRLSDHRYFANLFRLYLHTAAYNLLGSHASRRGRSAACASPARSSHRSPGR